MIIDDCIAFDEAGIKFIPGNFYIDPRKPVKNAVITHAHADHAKKGNENVYCTPATADLILHRYKTAFRSKITKINYHETFTVNGIKITFESAGHMLGSAQVLVEHNGRRFLFTGDFKLQSNSTCAPYDFIKADVLITEATFANPLIIHPDPIAEIKKLNDYPDNNFLLGTYMLGKAQRINQLIADNCNDKIILTHSTIAGFNKVYEKNGIKLDNWQPYSRKFFKQHHNCIYLVPPVTYKYYYNQFKTLKAFASGWKRLQHGADVELLISDHADWNDLIKVIETTQPSKVITLHGDGNHLKSYFKDRIEFVVLDDF